MAEEAQPTCVQGSTTGQSERSSTHNSETDVEAEAACYAEKIQESQPEKDPNVVDWDGEDDPEMALNWSARRKWTYILMLASLTLLTCVDPDFSVPASHNLTNNRCRPFCSSMFAPGIPLVMSEFQSTNDDLASFVVSVYLLGYAFGPLVIAPLSELYGRLPVYHVNTVLFILWNVACARSTSLNMLIAFRFLTGLAGACPLTIGAGTVADCFRQEERGKVMAIWTLPVLLGPSIGPVAGGYLSHYLGWRWNFWFLIIVVSTNWQKSSSLIVTDNAIQTGVVFIFCLVFQRESYAPAILERRARRLRKETGNMVLHSALQSNEPPRRIFLRAIIRPTKLLFMSPIVLGLSLLTAVVYGCLYLFFTTVSEMFVTEYGISEANVGLTYLGCGAGQFVGIITLGFISDRIVKRMAKGGEMKPEYRLPPLLPACFFMPAGLLFYGWTAQAHVHFMVPIIGTTLIGLGAICVFSPVATYLVDAFTTYAASATAANTVFRSIGGALLPLCGRRMYAALGFGGGNTLLACIGISMSPMIWVFLKYGEKIRKHPRFQVKL
jgi:multidrug resistance protein